MATTFPRIYSLCTVGVRQHHNSEYLFHPVRTDFTGGNGLGKSIIADLMQLIIVPRRDMWKPGTEGIGKDERRVEGIPLNRLSRANPVSRELGLLRCQKRAHHLAGEPFGGAADLIGTEHRADHGRQC